MQEHDQRLRITDYQPTPEEVEMLQREGLTLQQALEFDQPTAQQWKKLQENGYGLVEAIVNFNLRGNIRHALNQVSVLTIPGFPQEDFDRRIREEQTRAIASVTTYLSGNPYPGKDFSKAQGEQALEAMRSPEWNKANLVDCLARVRSIIDPPKPNTQPLPIK